MRAAIKNLNISLSKHFPQFLKLKHVLKSLNIQLCLKTTRKEVQNCHSLKQIAYKLLSLLAVMKLLQRFCYVLLESQLDFLLVRISDKTAKRTTKRAKNKN